MPLSPTLLGELTSILASFRAAHSGTALPSGSGKALESWLLLKLADEARSTGDWNVILHGGDGVPLAPEDPLILRSQPGAIAKSSKPSAGYILLDRILATGSPQAYELHGGLQWFGRSKSNHEWDVSLLPTTIGQALRGLNGGRPGGLPILGLECKDKTSSGTLDEMRQSLARLFDLAFVTKPAAGISTRIYEPISGTKWGKRSSQYIPFFKSGLFGIVRVGRFQSGAQVLAQHFSIGEYWGVYDSPSVRLAKLLSDFRTLLKRIETLH